MEDIRAHMYLNPPSSRILATVLELVFYWSLSRIQIAFLKIASKGQIG
jgi:hypothetical protein